MAGETLQDLAGFAADYVLWEMDEALVLESGVPRQIDLEIVDQVLFLSKLICVSWCVSLCVCVSVRRVSGLCVCLSLVSVFVLVCLCVCASVSIHVCACGCVCTMHVCACACVCSLCVCANVE